MPGQIRLSPEQVADLQKSQRELHDVLAEIDNLEQCGTDCQSYRAAWQQANDQISNLLNRFGPNATRERAETDG